MSDLKEKNSELVWNIVGVLAAIALLFYIVSVFFGPDSRGFIPVSGGGQPAFDNPNVPTAYVLKPQSTSSPTFPGSLPTATTQPAATNLPPTDTPTEEPFPIVITNFGPESQFTLHQLQPGESYTYLAELYDTTPEILELLNYNKAGKRLWVGQYVVVMPGLTQVLDSHPQFTVLQIEAPTSLADVSLEYGTSIDELRYYNSLAANVHQVSMRVLLVPIMVVE